LRWATVVLGAGKETAMRVPRLVSTKAVAASSPAAIIRFFFPLLSYPTRRSWTDGERSETAVAAFDSFPKWQVSLQEDERGEWGGATD
jgi:hypothetical protein